MSYEFSHMAGRFVVSDEMEDGLREYIDDGLEPGSFLEAVICNDFVGACSKADAHNLANLPAFAAYLYNEAPRDCWGSKEKMGAWISRKESERQEEAEREAEIKARQRRQDDEDARGDYLRDMAKDPDHGKDHR